MIRSTEPTTAIKVIVILSEKGFLLDFETTDCGYEFCPRNAIMPFGIRCLCGKVRFQPKKLRQVSILSQLKVDGRLVTVCAIVCCSFVK